MPPLCAKKSHNRYHYVKYVLQKKTERTRKIFGIISIFKTRPRAKIALILSEKNIFFMYSSSTHTLIQ